MGVWQTSMKHLARLLVAGRSGRRASWVKIEMSNLLSHPLPTYFAHWHTMLSNSKDRLETSLLKKQIPKPVFALKGCDLLCTSLTNLEAELSKDYKRMTSKVKNK